MWKRFHVGRPIAVLSQPLSLRRWCARRALSSLLRLRRRWLSTGADNAPPPTTTTVARDSAQDDEPGREQRRRRRRSKKRKSSKGELRHAGADIYLRGTRISWHRFWLLPWETVTWHLTPLNHDESIGLFTWTVWLMLLWALLSLTSVAAVAVWVVNSLEFGGLLADKLGTLLTANTGYEITFEQAVQPSWDTIRLNNVRVIYKHPSSTYPCYAEVDVRISEVVVSMSLVWWLEGKGIIRDAVIRGMRGVVNRSRVYDVPPGSSDAERERLWAPFRRTWNWGSPELDRLLLEDIRLTVYQPFLDRPVPMSIFYALAPRFRNQWLLYDLMTAQEMDGAIDGCLFTLRTPATGTDRHTNKRIFRITGVPIDLVQAGFTGPVSWLTQGTINYDITMLFPENPHDGSVEALPVPKEEVAINMHTTFENLSASVPLNPPDMSYMSNALIRPVVLYMNTNYTSIPLDVRFIMSSANFDGAWSPWDAGLVTAMSAAVGTELVRVSAEQTRASNVVVLMTKGLDGIARGLRHVWYVMWHSAASSMGR